MRKQGGLYLVGTPRGRLKKLERSFLSQSWDSVRDEVAVKLVRDKEELYVLTRSMGRRQKERGIRKRKLKKLWARLKELQAMKKLSRDELLMKLGAAKKEAGRAWNLVEVTTPGKDQTVTPETFRFSLNKSKLRQTRKDEGCYLLRTNYTDQAPEELWRTYILLTEVEQAFKELKNDLHLRPIYHQLDARIEAHIFVCFLAYCLNVTLKQADRYFLETLIRLHRAGEGAPYTGIKDEPVEPIVAMADKALADGSADAMIKKMSGHMAQAIKATFDKALEASKSKDKSVEAGREFVEAYVIYMHYVEGIHAAIMSAGGHEHANPASSEAG